MAGSLEQQEFEEPKREWKLHRRQRSQNIAQRNREASFSARAKDLFQRYHADRKRE